MHIFTIRKDAYAKGWKRVLIPLICIDAMIVLAYLLAVNGSMTDVEGSWIITLAILIGIMTVTAIRTARRQKKIYETFRLTISGNSIIREQHNTPAITIAKSEVREIRKLPNGTMAIVGESKLNAIGIPAEIENREMLEQLLSDIRPLTVKNYGRAKGYLSLFITIAAIGLLWAGMLSKNAVLFSISGAAMCALLLAGFILIQRGKKLRQTTEANELYHRHSIHFDSILFDHELDRTVMIIPKGGLTIVCTRLKTTVIPPLHRSSFFHSLSNISRDLFSGVCV